MTRELTPSVLAAGRNVYGAAFLVCATPLLGLTAVSDLWQWACIVGTGLLQGVAIWARYRALEASKASLVTAVVASSLLLTLVGERLFIGIDLVAAQWAGLVIVMLAAIWLALSDSRGRGNGDDPNGGGS